ncbi:cupredoxin domain-containing protein [Candidatus Saccharibacteria bacterium]|nr:cupredoxin domain-containing protein [Candidatus Saccharibacteria bacterium]
MEDEQKSSTANAITPATAGKKRKPLLLFLGILVLVAAAAAIYTANKSDDKAATSSQTATSQKAPTKITIKASGFTPATVTISKGGTVNWSNQDVVKHQVVISSYSGKENFSDFRTSDPIEINGIYGITLYKVGTYSYHDNLDPNQKGTIQVK